MISTKNFSALGKRLLQTFVTVLLLAVLAKFITADYARAQSRISVFVKEIMTARRQGYNRVALKARAMSLSGLIPESFRYLLDVSEGLAAPSRGELYPYQLYYEHVVEYVPSESSAYMMLGFCYYHNGEKDKAADLYRMAGALAPQSFWAYYNLGIIEMEKGKYKTALQSFQKAVKIPVEEILQYLYSSKTYSQFSRDIPDFQGWVISHLQKGQENIRSLMVLCYYHLQTPDAPGADIIPAPRNVILF